MPGATDFTPVITLVVEIALLGAVFGLVVSAIYLLVRAAARGPFGRDRRLEADMGAQVIRERFARGEITRDDAEAGLRALGRDPRGPA